MISYLQVALFTGIASELISSLPLYQQIILLLGCGLIWTVMIVKRKGEDLIVGGLIAIIYYCIQ